MGWDELPGPACPAREARVVGGVGEREGAGLAPPRSRNAFSEISFQRGGCQTRPLPHPLPTIGDQIRTILRISRGPKPGRGRGARVGVSPTREKVYALGFVFSSYATGGEA